MNQSDQESIDRAEAEAFLKVAEEKYFDVLGALATDEKPIVIDIYLTGLRAERERCSDYWEMLEEFQSCSEELTTLRKQVEKLIRALERIAEDKTIKDLLEINVEKRPELSRFHTTLNFAWDKAKYALEQHAKGEK